MDIPDKLVYDNRQVVHFKSVSSVFVFWVNLMIGNLEAMFILLEVIFYIQMLQTTDGIGYS